METLVNLYSAISQVASNSTIELALAATFGGIALLKFNSVLRGIKKLLSVKENKEKHTKSNFPKLIAANDRVLQAIKHYLRELTADRILIMTYHNGGSSISGIEFTKMSCTHEAVAPGNKPQQTGLLNIPVTAYSTLTKKAFSFSKACAVDDIAIFKEHDVSVFDLFKDHKAKSVVIIPLYDNDSFVIGFAIIEYCKHKRTFTEEYKEEIEHIMNRVSAIIASTISDMYVPEV